MSSEHPNDEDLSVFQYDDISKMLSVEEIFHTVTEVRHKGKHVLIDPPDCTLA
jgi:hypothetical protein